jgi:superfamily I DNA/RNA helicase
MVVGQSAKGLIKIATKWGSEISGEELLKNISNYLEEECGKFEAAGRQDKAERLTEKCGIVSDTIYKLVSNANPIVADSFEPPGGWQGAAKGEQIITAQDVVEELERMFGEGREEDGALKLSTVHRAKGKEWLRVFLLGRNRYMPSKFARTAEDKRQETNCIYVACTRAKEELVDVVVPLAKKGEPDWWEV